MKLFSLSFTKTTNLNDKDTCLMHSMIRVVFIVLKIK